MKKTNRRFTLCITLLVLNIAFIWGNSLLPGNISAAFSRWVNDLLSILVGGGGQGTSTGHGLLRKMAHFAEYCTLGMCLTWLMGMLKKRPWRSLLCGFLVACTDETIQCFVPDRGPGIQDVMIDTAGVCLGVMLLLLGHAIYMKNQKNLEENKQ